MDLRIYNMAEQFVFDSFNKAEKPSQIKHFVQTVHWLKILSPDADEALLVAAIALTSLILASSAKAKIGLVAPDRTTLDLCHRPLKTCNGRLMI